MNGFVPTLRQPCLLLVMALLVGCAEAPSAPIEPPPKIGTGPSPADAVSEPANPTGLLPVPEHGYQVKVGPFTVGPGEEVTRCGYAYLPLEQDGDLNRIETAMNTGSHHMNLYMALAPIDKEGTTVCGNDTMGQLVIFGAQQKYHDVPLPEGIGYAIPAQQQVILEAHYVNATLEPIEALGVANIHMAEPEDIEHRAGIMALFPESIVVPPNSDATVTSRCMVPFDAEVFILMSHMHRFGQSFEVHLVDITTTPETRTPIYLNEDWHVPEYTILPHGDFLHVPQGSVLEVSCHYANHTDQTVTGGPSADTNEMCIFGAAYVPYHGFLLCQKENVVCPQDPVNPDVDPNESLCAQYLDCINRCGDLNIECNNCCTPAMHPPCMLCLQGVLGCAMQNGCAAGVADFDLDCVATHCGEGYAECFLMPLDD